MFARSIKTHARFAVMFTVLATAALAGGPTMAAGTAPDGSLFTPAFSCERDWTTGKGTCSCKGYFDCKKLTEEGICTKPIDVCGAEAGKPDTCTCEWNKAAGFTPKLELDRARLAPIGSSLAR